MQILYIKYVLDLILESAIPRIQVQSFRSYEMFQKRAKLFYLLANSEIFLWDFKNQVQMSTKDSDKI